MSSATAFARSIKDWSERVTILNKRQHQERVEIIERHKLEHLALRRKYHPHVVDLLGKDEEDTERSICCKFNLEARRVYTSTAIESELRKSFVLHKPKTRGKPKNVPDKTNPSGVQRRPGYPRNPDQQPGIRGEQWSASIGNPRSAQPHDLAILPSPGAGIPLPMLPPLQRRPSFQENKGTTAPTTSPGATTEPPLHGRSPGTRHSPFHQEQERQLAIEQLGDLRRFRKPSRTKEPANTSEHSPNQSGDPHASRSLSEQSYESSSSENSYSISNSSRGHSRNSTNQREFVHSSADTLGITTATDAISPVTYFSGGRPQALTQDSTPTTTRCQVHTSPGDFDSETVQASKAARSSGQEPPLHLPSMMALLQGPRSGEQQHQLARQTTELQSEVHRLRQRIADIDRIRYGPPHPAEGSPSPFTSPVPGDDTLTSSFETLPETRL